MSGKEHRHRHNHDIVRPYFADLLFTSRSPRHLWRPHYQTHGNERLLLPRVPARRATISAAGRRFRPFRKRRLTRTGKPCGVRYIALQDGRRPTLYVVSLSRPTDAWVGGPYSFVTDIVVLYVLIICHINDGSRLPSLLHLS